jgi:hypothetical protein
MLIATSTTPGSLLYLCTSLLFFLPTPRVAPKRSDSVMPRRQPRPLQDGRRPGRHALTSRPDVTTGNTDVTPTASPPTSRGRKHPASK